MMSEPREPIDTPLGPSGGAEDTPDAGDLGRLGEEGGPVGLRVGRNPANLGDEVPEMGDVTHPEPVGETLDM